MTRRLSGTFYFVAGGVTLLLGLQGIAVIMSRAPSRVSPDPLSYSFFGWRAGISTFRNAGLPVREQRHPFHRQTPSPPSIFVVAAPQIPFQYDEAKALRDWVDAGGVFVFLTGAGWSYQQHSRESSIYDWVFPSLVASSSVSPTDPLIVFPKKAGEPSLTLVVRGPARESGCPWRDECFLTDEWDGVHGASFSLGRGTAYWFSSAVFLANGNILERDNFRYFYEFFKSLLQERFEAFPGETPLLIFDLYHHGHSAPGASQGWLEHPSLLYLLILLFVWTFSERKGIVRFRSPEKVYRGSSVTVEMVARLWKGSEDIPWLLTKMKLHYERQFRRKNLDISILERTYDDILKMRGGRDRLIVFAQAVASLKVAE
ncbi:MAG: DUF4350 domain-containing protein [bacterium JZ-2024 1]